MKQEFSARTAALDDRLGVGRCFDMTARDLTIGGRRARPVSYTHLTLPTICSV